MSGRSPHHVALGRALRQARVDAGLRQQDLAQRAEMDRGYLGGIERGERNVSYTNLHRLAVEIGVPLSRIIAAAEAGPDDPPPRVARGG